MATEMVQKMQKIMKFIFLIINKLQTNF